MFTLRMHDSEVREREWERKPARNSGSVSYPEQGQEQEQEQEQEQGMMVMMSRHERNSGSGRLSKVWMEELSKV